MNLEHIVQAVEIVVFFGGLVFFYLKDRNIKLALKHDLEAMKTIIGGLLVAKAVADQVVKQVSSDADKVTSAVDGLEGKETGDEPTGGN